MKPVPMFKDVRTLFRKDFNHYKRQRLPHFYFTPQQQHALQQQHQGHRAIPWRHWLRGRSAVATRKTLSWRLSSSLIIAFISLVTRLFMRCFVHLKVVNGHHLFEQVFFRPKGKGLLTIANHTSMLDDPMLWAILPFPATWRHLLMRWSLGAKEIMFVGTFDSFFFKSGQVIPTIRGDGIHQAAMDEAIDILANGGWVHVFPEAKISQHPPDTPLVPFKWGIGRLILEAPTCPVVVPMFHYGMQNILPEDGTKRIPRLFQHLYVECGAPILDELSAFRRNISNEAKWRHDTTTFASSPSDADATVPREDGDQHDKDRGMSASSPSSTPEEDRRHYLRPPILPHTQQHQKTLPRLIEEKTLDVDHQPDQVRSVDALTNAHAETTPFTDSSAHQKKIKCMEEDEERIYARWQITTFLYHKMEELRKKSLRRHTELR